MPIDTSVWASDLGAMIADLPATAVFNGQTFTVSITELGVDQTLLLVGNLTKFAISITFLRSSLSSASIALLLPQANITVQRPNDAAAVKYEIVANHKPADDIALTLILKYDHKR